MSIVPFVESSPRFCIDVDEAALKTASGFELFASNSIAPLKKSQNPSG